MMKNILALSLIWSVFVLGCTSDESRMQDRALAEAKELYRQEALDDIAKGVTGKAALQKTAAHVLTEKAKFEVQKVDVQRGAAVVVVQALTVPLKARSALIEIMGKLDPSKERNFNVSDALQMILQQMELVETRSLLVYKIKFEKSNGWQVVKESPAKK